MSGDCALSFFESAFRVSDNALVVKRDKDDSFFIPLYVDALLITSSSEQLTSDYKTKLAKKWEMSYMGPIQFFLGPSVLQGNPFANYLSG